MDQGSDLPFPASCLGPHLSVLVEFVVLCVSVPSMDPLAQYPAEISIVYYNARYQRFTAPALRFSIRGCIFKSVNFFSIKFCQKFKFNGCKLGWSQNRWVQLHPLHPSKAGVAVSFIRFESWSAHPVFAIKPFVWFSNLVPSFLSLWYFQAFFMDFSASLG